MISCTRREQPRGRYAEKVKVHLCAYLSYRNHVPKIACFNHAETPLGVDFDDLIAAMQKFVDDHFAPVWATPAQMVKSKDFLKGAWATAFLDSERDASLEGYHDVTPEGLPMSKVFSSRTS